MQELRGRFYEAILQGLTDSLRQDIWITPKKLKGYTALI